MNWFGIFLVTYWAVNALGAVALIGKHRKPITPAVAVVMVAWAVVMVAWYVLLIWGFVAVGTGR